MQLRSKGLALLLGLAILLPGLARADSSAPVIIDPFIQGLVDSVDGSRLLSRITVLANFNTRHTWSDSTQITTGVGAARKWVKAQFDTISAHSGGALTTSYFDWYQFGTRWSRNVMAVKPATGPYANQIVAIGGHLDSRTVLPADATGYQPGANDDASGAMTAMECAQLMAPYAWERTIQYHNFTGEEQGLLGSKAYAQHADSMGVDIRAVIALDIVGSSENADGYVDTTRVRTFADTAAVSRTMQRYMKRIGEAYVPGFEVVIKPRPDRAGRGSDHLSFSDAGYSAIRLIEMKERLDRQHSGNDLVAWIRPTYHARVTKVALAALANLAQAPVTPSGVTTSVTPGGHLRITWSPNSEGDLAGYLVGYRLPDLPGVADDSSIVGATQYTMVDVGLVTEHILVGPSAGDSIYVGVAARDTGGHESILSREIGKVMPLATDVPVTSGEGVRMFGLGEPRPNPASEGVEVLLSAGAGNLPGTLSVYDVQGKRLRTLVSGALDGGVRPVGWDLRDEAGHRVPAGLYFIRLEAVGETISRKVVISP